MEISINELRRMALETIEALAENWKDGGEVADVAIAEICGVCAMYGKMAVELKKIEVEAISALKAEFGDNITATITEDDK